MSLNLSSSQSENALKQLKTLTSPLSKLAKGMQNFGMNLDPRKMNVRVRFFFFLEFKKKIYLLCLKLFQSPVSLNPEEPIESESQKLQEKWESCKCKTKLIAL